MATRSETAEMLEATCRAIARVELRGLHEAALRVVDAHFEALGNPAEIDAQAHHLALRRELIDDMAASLHRKD